MKKGEGRERHITQEEVIFTNDPPVPTERPTDRPTDRETDSRRLQRQRVERGEEKKREE